MNPSCPALGDSGYGFGGAPPALDAAPGQPAPCFASCRCTLLRPRLSAGERVFTPFAIQGLFLPANFASGGLNVPRVRVPVVREP